MTKKQKGEARCLLNVLKKSCREGRDGTWDCATAEGREGFDDMIILIARVQELIKE